MLLLTLLLLLLLAVAKTEGDAGLAEAWRILGWTNVTVYHDPKAARRVQVWRLARTSSREGVLVTFRSLEDLSEIPRYEEVRGECPVSHGGVAVLHDDWADADGSARAMNAVVMSGPQSGMVVTGRTEAAVDYWRGYGLATGFFLYARLRGRGLVQRIIMTRRGVAGSSGEVTAIAISSPEERERVMTSGMGLAMEVGILPYAPHLTFEYDEASAGGYVEGTVVGIVKDMLDQMASTKNFTYR